MKAKPITNKDVEIILKSIHSVILKAVAEHRAIKFECWRQLYEKPTDYGSVVEYDTTGEVFIEISTGVGSAEYINILDEMSDLNVRYCGRCLCFRPVSEFVKRGRTCLQCRDPKKDVLESKA